MSTLDVDVVDPARAAAAVDRLRAGLRELGPVLVAFSGGADSALLASYFAYDPAFTGGVFVSAGADMNFDGLADVVTGAGAGGGPHVKVFDTARMGAKDATGVLPDGRPAGGYQP